MFLEAIRTEGKSKVIIGYDKILFTATIPGNNDLIVIRTAGRPNQTLAVDNAEIELDKYKKFYSDECLTAIAQPAMKVVIPIRNINGLIYNNINDTKAYVEVIDGNPFVVECESIEKLKADFKRVYSQKKEVVQAPKKPAKSKSKKSE